MSNYIVKDAELGRIHISDDVIAHVVKDAIKDNEGIGGISSTPGTGIVEKVGLKSPIKGMKVSFDDNTINVEVTITVNYGFNILDVSSKAQKSIASELQSITGIDQVRVDIIVSGICFA